MAKRAQVFCIVPEWNFEVADLRLRNFGVCNPSGEFLSHLQRKLMKIKIKILGPFGGRVVL
jgi:hypothetical protein